MNGPHLVPPHPSAAGLYGNSDTPSSSSLSPSHAQLTPESNGSEASDAPTAPSRTPTLPRLQTEFNDDDEEDMDEEEMIHGSPENMDSGDEEYRVHANKYREPESPDSPEPRSGLSSKSYSASEEQQVVRKFDRRLVLFMAVLYLLSFLDRSNIGNAKIAGLSNDLHLSPSQYEWLLTAFYITYILFEWMTLMYRLVPPHIYISVCVCSWGLIASFQALATNFGTLVFLRAALGIAEAAFGPGVPFYLSFFYKREELAFRTGLFISAAPLATSFASSLAWLIVKSSTAGPIAPWRTLFLVEGFPSVIVAVFAWLHIPDGPGKARYLSPRERKVAKLRLREEQGGDHQQDEAQEGKFRWREITRTLQDPKSYLTAFMFFSCNVAFSSLPVFLPTIIQDMGYSSVTSQALSAPPYLFAFIVVLITASLSDRSRSRSPYIIFHALTSSLAYFLIGLTGVVHSYLPETVHVLIRYLCIYPAAAGFFSAITIIITWTMDNKAAKEGKGTGMAVLNIIGQCGPLVGTRLYPKSQGPWYVPGMLACAVFMLGVAGLAFTLRSALQRENARLDRGISSSSGAGDLGRDLGDEIEMAMANGEGEGEGLMGNTGPGPGARGMTAQSQKQYRHII